MFGVFVGDKHDPEIRESFSVLWCSTGIRQLLGGALHYALVQHRA